MPRGVVGVGVGADEHGDELGVVVDEHVDERDRGVDRRLRRRADAVAA